MESLPSPQPSSAFRVFFFDLPFRIFGRPGGPLGASLGFAALTGAATEALALAGDAFAGTAGVFAFGLSRFFCLRRDCSMNRAFTSSRSSTENSCNFPQR